MALWIATLVAAPFYGPLNVFPWNHISCVYHWRFLAGMLVALWRGANTPLPAPRLLAGLGAAWFVGSALVNAYGGRWNLWDPILGSTPSCVLLMVGLIHAERAGLLRVPELLVHLGDASFSIYLVHFPAPSALAKLAKVMHADAWLPLPLLFGLIAGGAVLVSYAFYRIVECPLRRCFKERRDRAGQDAPAEATQRRAA